MYSSGMVRHTFHFCGGVPDKVVYGAHDTDTDANDFIGGGKNLHIAKIIRNSII